jgi:hypothetical protein
MCQICNLENSTQYLLREVEGYLPVRNNGPFVAHPYYGVKTVENCPIFESISAWVFYAPRIAADSELYPLTPRPTSPSPSAILH